LGAECEAEHKAVKKAVCECHHEGRKHFLEIFIALPACKEIRPLEHKKDGKEHHHEHKEHSCEHKDYCKLGFDALVHDLEEHRKAHPHHHHHHHHEEHQGQQPLIKVNAL